VKIGQYLAKILKNYNSFFGSSCRSIKVYRKNNYSFQFIILSYSVGPLFVGWLQSPLGHGV